MAVTTKKKVVRALVNSLPMALKRYVLELLTTDLHPGVAQGADGERVNILLTQSIDASDTGNYTAAEQALEDAIIIAPNDPRLPPYLSRVRFLRDRANNPDALAETEKMLATLAAMDAEIGKKAIYVPGEFWETWGSFNVRILKEYGVENFKRTVSHNYQNWMMIGKDDPQVRRLQELWPSHRSHQPWLNAMEAPSHVGTPNGFQSDNHEYPLADLQQREVYRVAVGQLWEYVLSTDTSGIVDGLTELELGNPLRIWRNGSLISSDVAHSIKERNLLLKNLELNGQENLTVAELGAGHGRLAEIFGRTTNYRHVIFDITPALYVSQWYIKRAFPSERIFEFRPFNSFAEIEEELRECRFAFFTPNQIEQFPDDAFDLFINMNSLMEMRIDQIHNFLSHISRLTRRAFLSRQWFKRHYDEDKQSVEKKDFVLDNRWKIILDEIDDIYPDFFIQIWSKESDSIS
ncbi:MAG: hypothetical protein DRR42_20180 [Gammaproteobacteria bacterium]|nr:MAG: hypothetical protein DRR42_20180 [Gammaproteobacteria bacterium]